MEEEELEGGPDVLLEQLELEELDDEEEEEEEEEEEGLPLRSCCCSWGVGICSVGNPCGRAAVK